MNDKRLRLQQHWWLGFLGIIGIVQFPGVLDAFHGTVGFREYLQLGWLIGFSYFIPIREEGS